jgi:DNA-binding transcriptional MerR regulator
MDHHGTGRARWGTLAAGDPPGHGMTRANGRVRDVPNERLIRWYATVGLVDPPLSRRGRVARYGPRHLLQLVAIKRRQAEGRSLAEIQAELAGATNASLAAVARVPDVLEAAAGAVAGPARATGPSAGSPGSPAPAARSASALGGSETVCRMQPSPAQRAALTRLAAELAAAAGPALPGALTVRAYACGKPACRCHADPPALHGPYAEMCPQDKRQDGHPPAHAGRARRLAGSVRQREKDAHPARRAPGTHPHDRRGPASPATNNPQPGKTSWA